MNGCIFLTMPGQFTSPLYDLLRPHLVWFGLAFVLAGLGLVVVSLAPRLPASLTWLVHLLAATAFLAYTSQVSIPAGSLTGIIYYVGFGAVIAILPWLGPRLVRLNPGSLQTRLALALAIPTALAILAAIALDTAREERAVAAQALAAQTSLATALMRQTEAYIGLHMAQVSEVAHRPFLLSEPPGRLHEALVRTASLHPQYTALIIVDRDGSTVARSDDLPFLDYTGLPHFEEPRRTNAPAVTVRFGRSSARPVVLVSVPIQDDGGAFAGVVLGAIDARQIAAVLAHGSGSGDALVYLLDAKGDVVVHPDDALTSTFANLAATPPVAALLAAQGPGAIAYNGPTGEILAGYATSERLGWGVVVEHPAAGCW